MQAPDVETRDSIRAAYGADVHEALPHIIEDSLRDPMCSVYSESPNWFVDDAACTVKDGYDMPFGDAFALVCNYLGIDPRKV